MRRVLVTGGTGFVGANLVQRCLSMGDQVHLLVRKGFAPWRIKSLRSELRFFETDLSSITTLDAALREVRPDWVFHLAACGGYSWQTDREEIFRTNLQGTMNLLDACTKVGFGAFVQAGSSSEYGWQDHPPAETERIEPNSHYAVAKAAATHYGSLVARSRGLPVSTLRLYSVYGPYEDPRRFVPTLIRLGLSGCLPPLVSPDVARDFLHVDDAVEAFLAVAQAGCKEPGAVYNVGTGVQTTVRRAVEVARHELAISAEPEWGTMPDRIWDTSVWVADARKIELAVGWRAKVDFEPGFRAAVKWARDAGGLGLWEWEARDAP